MQIPIDLVELTWLYSGENGRLQPRKFQLLEFNLFFGVLHRCLTSEIQDKPLTAPLGETCSHLSSANVLVISQISLSQISEFGEQVGGKGDGRREYKPTPYRRERGDGVSVLPFHTHSPNSPVAFEDPDDVSIRGTNPDDISSRGAN